LPQARLGTSNRKRHQKSLRYRCPFASEVRARGAAMDDELRKRGTTRVADSTGNWVDRGAPAWTRPYLRLARLYRPIGSWLLLLPCWWSVGLAAVQAGGRVHLWHVVLFFVGAFAMRG